jgi:branched-chain amino acid transport system substrate-binding protein
VRAGLALVLVATLAAVSGCGGKSAVPNRVGGTQLTIYSSAPLRGASAIDARSVINGELLALAQIGSRIGRYRIVFHSLDDSSVARDEWDPGQTTLNAREAIKDTTTIGYIGDFDSGASAVSIPLLNRFDIPQISPTSTAVGLTTSQDGASPGEPEKYYPTGIRTYARVVPNDSIQAAVQVKVQKQLGCDKTFVLDDGEVDGEDLAMSFEALAQTGGLKVVGLQQFDPRATNYKSLALGVASTGADCVLVSAITESNATLVTRWIAGVMPHALIFGSAGVAESTFTNPADGGIPLSLDPRVTITVATLPASDYPPAGQAFFKTYTRLFGTPQPDAILGYEAMSLMLSAIRTATDGGTEPALRSKVLAAIFATRNRHGALGTYSIDRQGDTTLHRYGVWRVVDGRLRFWQAMTP